MATLFAVKAEDGASAAALLLPWAAWQVWGLSSPLETAPGPQGKPFFPDRPELHFNLSHSGPYALCGLSGSPVGVDIEQMRPRSPVLAKRALSSEEYDWYVFRGSRWEDFYTLWTLKEARVKCLGMGLRTNPASIAVPLLEPGESGVRDGLIFTAYGGGDYRAALCSSTDTAMLDWVSFS